MPTGVVSFVFDDIEGSTRPWEDDTDGMRRSLARHDALAREVVEGAGGHLFKHTGDGYGAAFVSASAGITAAVTTKPGTSSTGPRWRRAGWVRPSSVGSGFETHIRRGTETDWADLPLSGVL